MKRKPRKKRKGRRGRRKERRTTRKCYRVGHATFLQRFKKKPESEQQRGHIGGLMLAKRKEGQSKDVHS